jgi:hypothetical protein
VVGQAGASALGAKAPGDNGSTDANHVVTGTAVEPVAVEPTAVEPAAVPTIAVASMPAPSSSTDIRLTVTNKSGASTIGARDVQAVIVDCFGALNGDALTIDDVFSVTAPPGGSASVNVGTGSTMGPAVLTFTGFNNGESSAFNLDPDTWDNAAFGATRLQMGKCRVEVVFVRLGSETPLRASGFLVHTSTDKMVAKLLQVNP